MYEKYFGLTERPFSIAPDPRFLYMSQQHREALAHVLYGVGEGGGFVQLTGEVGTGKTTICRCLLEQMPDHVDIALILNPRVTALELLASLCDELQIQYARDTTSIKSVIDALTAYLLDSHARGRRTVLMVDEAQNLSADALEQVRLLTNLETTREKLLQIILVGQPELRVLLARDDLRQLSQRITARYHIEPIDHAETAAYIRHRLQVCGATSNLFTSTAIELIFKLSNGIPRLINVLSDRALLGAFVEGKRMVDAPIVQRAARETLAEDGVSMPGKGVWRWFGMGAVVVFAGLTSYFLATTLPLSEPPRLAMNSVQRPVVEEPPIGLSASGAEALQGNETENLSKVESEPRLESESLAMDLSLVLARTGPNASSRAWKSLYRLWGVQSSVTGDEQACVQAFAAGLRCLEGRGGWADLRRFDRPVLLLLVTTEGRHVPVLVREVAGSQLRVQVDGRDLEMPIKELDRYWLGEYRLLWKVPPSGSDTLRPGDRNADVKWLRARMAKATGQTAIAPDPLYFDVGLKELVRSFQRNLRMNANGVADARIFIKLNNLDRASSVPRLGAVTASR